MSFLRVLAAAAVRVVAITAFYLIYVEALARSESTDALGAGLMFLLILVVVALAWATYDGARRGFGVAVVVWLLTAAAFGVTITVAFVFGTDTTAGEFGDELRDGWPVFTLLVFVPALPGSAVGGLIHRSRGRASAV